MALPATPKVVIDAKMPQGKHSRKREPKRWTIVATEQGPQFSTIDGKVVLHIGFQLGVYEKDSTKLALTDDKLYLRVGVEEKTSYIYVEENDGLEVAHGPGYAVFPCGSFKTDHSINSYDKQTAYKRAWQMTYEEWKADDQLTIDADDEDAFKEKLSKYRAQYKEDGRERQGVKSLSTRALEAENVESVKPTMLSSANQPGSSAVIATSVYKKNPAGAVSAKKTPADEMPTNKAPISEMAIDETPTSDVRIDKTQSSKPITNETGADGIPINEIAALGFTTFHLANPAREPKLGTNFESTTIMTEFERATMTAQLRAMGENVPPNATLETVVGIWKVPNED